MNGNFFAVNCYQWEQVISCGINVACLYLVMARGTGPDNVSTLWSAHALETYTNVSRRRAKTAKETLLKSGCVKQVKGGNHPAYKIKRPKNENPKQDLIWLPNELVTGLDIGVSPLERVRQTGDILCLRLLIDLYDDHNLIDDCGISRHLVREKYERKRIAESGACIIWGFTKLHPVCNSHHPSVDIHSRLLTDKEIQTGKHDYEDFFQRIFHLINLGLISFFPHLCESNEPDAEIIHPLIDAYTENCLLGSIAHDTALSMLNEKYYFEAENWDYLIPALSHMQNIHVVGIGVLRYRPKTKLTAAGYANNLNATKHWVKAYEDMTEHPEALSMLKNIVNV
jgi:hypothetical protein